jgi:hypothetical protein
MPRITEQVHFSPAELAPIKAALAYLIEAEEHHYIEHVFNNLDPLPPAAFENIDVLLDKAFYTRPDVDHIYAVARRAKDVIDSKCVRP